MQEISSQLQEELQLKRNFTFIFLEALSQTEANINDQVQQQYWKKETDKLWRKATERGKTFDFITIDEAVKDNVIFKREIEKLNDIIDNKFKQLYETQAETKAALSGISSNIKENKDTISDLSNRTLGSVIPKINDLSSSITGNKFAIDLVRDWSSKNELDLNKNKDAIIENKVEIKNIKVRTQSNGISLTENKNAIQTLSSRAAMNEGNLQQQENSINNLSEKTSHNRQSISALSGKHIKNEKELGDLAVKINKNEQAMKTRFHVRTLNKFPNRINVSSSGPAAEKFPYAMGVYELDLTKTVYNKPVYKKTDNDYYIFQNCKMDFIVFDDRLLNDLHNFSDKKMDGWARYYG